MKHFLYRETSILLQWNSELWTHLGPAISSFIERLSSLQRLKCTSIIEKGHKSVPFIERFFLSCPLLGVSFIGGSTVAITGKNYLRWIHNSSIIRRRSFSMLLLRLTGVSGVWSWRRL